jgi:hypothetical protein
VESDSFLAAANASFGEKKSSVEVTFARLDRQSKTDATSGRIGRRIRAAIGRRPGRRNVAVKISGIATVFALAIRLIVVP